MNVYKELRRPPRSLNLDQHLFSLSTQIQTRQPAISNPSKFSPAALSPSQLCPQISQVYFHLVRAFSARYLCNPLFGLFVASTTVLHNKLDFALFLSYCILLCLKHPLESYQFYPLRGHLHIHHIDASSLVAILDCQRKHSAHNNNHLFYLNTPR